MYDFIMDSLHTIFKNGFTVTSGVAILFLLLKQRKMKRQLKKYLPHLFADDEPNTHYINNQQIIMKKLDRLLEERGITWTASTSNVSLPPTAKKSAPSWLLRYRMNTSARNAIKYTGLGRKKTMSRWSKIKAKLLQRKFLLALGAAALVICNDGLGLGLDGETIKYVVGIVATWIFGEAGVDAVRARTQGKEQSNAEYFGDDGPAV